MKRVALTCLLAGFVFVAGSAFGANPDIVYFRESAKKKDEKLIGKIEKESPSGIKLKPTKGEVTNIPALQITQIEYGAGADVVGALDFRRPDSKLLLALAETKAEKRVEGLRMTLVGFQTLADDEKLRRLTPIHRYFKYRVAQTLYYLSREDASRRDAAIAALMSFKTNHADGWEIVPALQLLASLQEEKGDTEGASQTFSDLANLDGIDKDMQFQSRLKGARLLMLVNKFADADSKLKEVETKLSADDPRRVFVDAYLIQSRIAQKGNLDGVDTKLHQILRASKDGNLLALSHNSLGDYYRAKGDLDQAFWEYCKVDMLYNQDREEHAKALFYLSRFSDARRHKLAEDALTRLKSSSFDGTLFQRQALADKKTGE
jgi:hypothetical protein